MGLFGMDSYMVQVEADLSQGLPRFDIVGLPDAAISEAKNRVRSRDLPSPSAASR